MLCRAAAALTLKSKKCFDVYCILRYNEPCNYKNLITGNLRGGVEVPTGGKARKLYPKG